MPQIDRWTLQIPTLCILGAQFVALLAVGAFVLLGEPGAAVSASDTAKTVTATADSSAGPSVKTVAATVETGQGQVYSP